MEIIWGNTMTGSKHFDKIAWTVTALMLVVTILFMNGASFGMEVLDRAIGYENRLFDNTKVHSIDIVMHDWEDFIANAASEEYYAANVVIDGEAYKNVGIRGKGNTSLSTVSSLGSERYSFKIEFDQYDSAISYHGLDKLSLNNLIQDSTMMKDYLSYTMMREFDATAPLCSFVYITVNGEDWGLYLAVEGVEDAFLQRNYGSVSGELYKPDSMSFGGGRGNGRDFNMDEFDFGRSESESSRPERNAENFDTSSMPEGFDPSSMPEDFDPSSMFGGDSAPSSMPEDFDPSSIFGGDAAPSSMPEGFAPSSMFGGDSAPSSIAEDSETVEVPEGGKESRGSRGSGKGGFGGFGMGSSDVKLQYIDDDVDSYTNIWNNAKTDITEADQKRLIESLKKLSAGEEISSVVDIEKVIRYFVVHNYICNDDSYTGMMVHNYYLYEENGQMSMIPWDYNLGYGTFGGSNATSTVNTPIDMPVTGGASDRPMLNWIFENEEYTQMYHEYFAEFINTVDIQGMIDQAYELIKSYVEKDPTAFYTYEEFEKGVETMRQFCALRSESISQQLENGETASNQNYVDASGITLSDMGSMSGMGGFGGGMPNMPGGDFDPSSMFGGEMPEGFDSSQMPEGFDGSQMPQGFPGGTGSMSAANSGSEGLITLLVSVVVLGAGLVIAKKYRY